MSSGPDADGPVWPSPWGNGFLPSARGRRYRLGELGDAGAAGAAWEAEAARLPAVLLGGPAAVEAVVGALPEFPLGAVVGAGEAACWRALSVISFLSHALVWADAEAPRTRLPAALAVPLVGVAARLEVQPILSYATYNLLNWEFIVPDGGEGGAREPTLGSCASALNFHGGRDEMWFRAVHVAIEACFGRYLRTGRLRPAARGDDAAGVTSLLEAIAECLAEMQALLDRMPEGCDPAIYYKRVRQPMSGWRSNPLLPDGLVYEGVGDGGGSRRFIYGETGAQSSILPAIDAILGVAHREGWLTDYLREMRAMMPREHRAFLEELEARGSVRPFVDACARETAASPAAAGVVAAYNGAIDALQSFRGTHKHFAYTYIAQFGRAAGADGAVDRASERGTGGTRLPTRSCARPAAPAPPQLTAAPRTSLLQARTLCPTSLSTGRRR